MFDANRGVLLLSGGLDSTVCLAYCRDMGVKVCPLAVHYGQRHIKELFCAREITAYYGNAGLQELYFEEFSNIAKGSSQTDLLYKVPEGHYSAENMKVTVVPNRNMVLLSLATAYAVSRRAGKVIYAAHAGDHAIYPDCRPEFAEALNEAIGLATDGAVELYRPFMHHTKADIVKIGIECGVPFHLTWSCYNGREKACGRCGTCVERLEAFLQNGKEDPLEYEDREWWRTQVDPASLR